MKTSCKRLKRGDLFTVSLSEKVKSESKSSIMCGDILRMVTKASPYIIVDIYDRREKKWNASHWNVHVDDHVLIRLKKKLLKKLFD